MTITLAEVEQTVENIANTVAQLAPVAALAGPVGAEAGTIIAAAAKFIDAAIADAQGEQTVISADSLATVQAAQAKIQPINDALAAQIEGS